MISKGYILVHCLRDSEKHYKNLLLFSTDYYELKEIENEFNSKQFELRKRISDTESFRKIYFEFYNRWSKRNYFHLGQPNKEEFNLFIKEFPIPEELEDLVLEKVWTDSNGNELCYLEEPDFEKSQSYYSIRELQGV